MANFNKIILFGRLTRDPELTYLPSQTPVVEFGIATSRKFKGNDGQMREDTCFVDCRMYGKRAEVIQKYVHKGDPLLVEGRLTFDRWEAQDGSKRSKHRVFVESFEFGGGNRQQSNQGGGPVRSSMDEQGMAQGQDNGPISNGMDDDIPF